MRADEFPTTDRLLDTIAVHGLAGAWARLHISWRTWRQLLAAHPTLAVESVEAERYALERIARRALVAVSLAGDDLSLKRAKILIDHARWLLERRAPDRYGSRVQMDVNVQFDLRVAVEEARERVRLVSVVPVQSAAERLLG